MKVILVLYFTIASCTTGTPLPSLQQILQLKTVIPPSHPTHPPKKTIVLSSQISHMDTETGKEKGYEGRGKV